MLSLTRTWAVMVKEFVQLTRDRLTYAMILALPIVQLLLFGYAINTDPKQLPTAVLVQENSVFARSALSAIRNSGYFDIVAQVRTPAELDTLVRQGEVQFAVTIPGDFSRRVVRGDKAQLLVEADASDPAATGGAAPRPGGRPERQPLRRSRPGRRRRPRPAIAPCRRAPRAD